MQTSRIRTGLGVFVVALALCLCSQLLAGVTASISGTVTDPSGAIVAGATVTATNVETGVATTQPTNASGYYSFQSLPLGTYTIDVAQTGFKEYAQTGLVLDVNSALVVDVKLQVGASSEKVEVSSTALHVDTQSTQMGEVITGKEMTDVPLVTRSYTDLLEFAARCCPECFAAYRSFCRSIHLGGLCRSFGFGRFEFRGGLGKWYARIRERLHPQWSSGPGVGIFWSGSHPQPRFAG